MTVRRRRRASDPSRAHSVYKPYIDVQLYSALPLRVSMPFANGRRACGATSARAG